MTRAVYTLDFRTTDYVEQDRVRNEDPTCYDFRAEPKDVAVLRKPRCLVVSVGGRIVWELVGFQRLPGPPVDNKHSYRMCLSRMQ